MWMRRRSPQEAPVKVLSHITFEHSYLLNLCPFSPPAIMTGSQLPGLEFSSLEAISASIFTTRKSFLEHKTRDVEFRLIQLRKLY